MRTAQQVIRAKLRAGRQRRFQANTAERILAALRAEGYVRRDPAEKLHRLSGRDQFLGQANL